MACANSAIVLIVQIKVSLTSNNLAARYAAVLAIKSTCPRVLLVASSMKLTPSCSESSESPRHEEEPEEEEEEEEEANS